jgi:hypothetical protein
MVLVWLWQTILFFCSATPCASSPPRPSIFSEFSFLAHQPVNWDDRHLLAHAMASHLTVAWQFSQREHFFVTDQTPRPDEQSLIIHV